MAMQIRGAQAQLQIPPASRQAAAQLPAHPADKAALSARTHTPAPPTTAGRRKEWF